jgi:hypothetical protein
MSEELGPIDIVCDAPPYPVVRACQRLGFRDPQDVRWCRANHFAAPRSCACGQTLPPLESYTFTFVTGNQASYLLAQCRRCQSIYWEKA